MADLDAVFSRIFAAALYSSADHVNWRPPVVVLSGLAQELEAEAGANGQKPVLDAAVLDRVLVSRLIESPPSNYPQPPIHYLMGCYERSSEELRRAGTNEQVKAAVAAARDLVLNYAGLALFAGIVAQPPAIEARGSLQLMDALLLRHGLPTVALTTAVAPAFAGPGGGGGGEAAAAAYTAGAVPMPPGFLEELAVRHDNDEGLADAVSKIGFLPDTTVSSCPVHEPGRLPIARGAVVARAWLPADLRAVSGRAVVLPGACWLGPFFNISPIPDDVRGATVQEPAVLAQCFTRMEGRRPGDVNNAVSGLRLAMRNITGQLNGVVKSLLKMRSTKAGMIRWLGAVLDGNAGRAKLRFDPEALAPDGFLANVAAVLLKLCGPFMDISPASPFWKRVDPGFVAAGGLLDASYGGETRLAAASDEEAAWRERIRSHAAASASAGGAGGGSGPASPTGASAAAAAAAGGGVGGPDGGGDFHFICQAFFLTCHALHIGPVRSMTHLESDLAHNVHFLRSHVTQTEAMMQELSNPGERAMAELALTRARAQLDYLQARYQAFLTVLLDPALVTDILGFYRLMAAWLTSLATGSPWGSGATSLSLPLPEPAPQDFTCMPEYFVEDMCSVLLFVSRFAPQLLSSAADGAGVRLDEFAVFFTTLMASPKYIRSAFLRQASRGRGRGCAVFQSLRDQCSCCCCQLLRPSKLSEVLELWLPQSDEEDQGGRSAFRRRAPAGPSAELAALFNCHPLVVQNLTPVLVRLYNDIEHTEREGAFYFKFNMRTTIANILKYLWAQPHHRAVWLAAVRAEEYRGNSERFSNMLLNDLTYLLDEASAGGALKLLKLLREAEDTRADEARWAAMSREDRDELVNMQERNGNNLTAMIRSATSVIDTLNFITEEADTTRTLLQPHMVERLRDSLNYFLKYLVGPERRQLRVRNPEKYNFNARELLRGLVTVYLHVDAIDRGIAASTGTAPVFAAAVGGDKRSFKPEYFLEALAVLDASGLLNVGQREQLEALSQRALAASSVAEEEDEVMGEDVPEEFMCAIMSTIMKARDTEGREGRDKGNYDPVRLPSGVVVDRPNILRHLLSDATDPFSRMPLTEAQLVPEEGLAARIAEWRRTRSTQ
ncbi:hypothetical protein VOLCADRAFT_87432 [Volvox carteri f. nagariensis]|uniref:U-box domain-containing protein n=1 Tax=Volvox carteri f. nagariensis TaxID=3068 RepID=D8TLB8_VOLCA|nr:uncharacterized protein VOLCADRAFT_87432 [Volvox carteri f. nagariensis]EFJ51708.1 hypothetical protein VOLCADRAFT_87432 [Volvox carteri f. nagariensis]|eukprot:XP_002947118.1 hypothetical protein VOLCADRAFT_87432 [Volvox carteri f. nagariensis]